MIRQRVLNYPIAPHVVHKSVEFSGGLVWFVDPLDHYKHVLTAPARCSQYKISHVHDVWQDYIIAEVGGL